MTTQLQDGDPLPRPGALMTKLVTQPPNTGEYGVRVFPEKGTGPTPSTGSTNQSGSSRVSGTLSWGSVSSTTLESWFRDVVKNRTSTDSINGSRSWSSTSRTVRTKSQDQHSRERVSSPPRGSMSGSEGLRLLTTKTKGPSTC